MKGETKLPKVKKRHIEKFGNEIDVKKMFLLTLFFNILPFAIGLIYYIFLN